MLNIKICFTFVKYAALLYVCDQPLAAKTASFMRALSLLDQEIELLS